MDAPTYEAPGITFPGNDDDLLGGVVDVIADASFPRRVRAAGEGEVNVPAELLAKSAGKDRPAITLRAHLMDARTAADTMWDSIEADLVRAVHADRDRLRPLLQVSMLLHDLGKANSSFQAILSPSSGAPRQPVRQEVWSAVIASEPRLLGAWLAGALDDDARWALVWAVGGHHLQLRPANPNEDDPLFRSGDAAERVTLHLAHPDVASVLGEVRAILSAQRPLAEAPLPADRTLDTLDEDSEAGVKPWVLRLVRTSRHAMRAGRGDGRACAR